MANPTTSEVPATGHKIVSREEWLVARKAHLQKEKALTRLYDELRRERSELPWTRVEKNYVFDGPLGEVTLADLFCGRRQLMIQHFMFGPSWDEGCVGCSFGADHVDAAMVHLEQHDVSFAAVARAPFPKLAAYKERMGWQFNFVSSLESDFNYDFHVSFRPEDVVDGKVDYNYDMRNAGMEEASGNSVFFKDETGVYHTYSSFARGTESLVGAYAYMDMMPKGRNEPGPTFSLMDWVKRHDEYGPKAAGHSCCAHRESA